MIMKNMCVRTLSVALILTLICATLAGCAPELNNDEKNILYNGIVYERCEGENYNVYLYEDNSWYIGDFVEVYAYGQEIPWPVHVLNGDENVLYSSHATWVKPGYAIPDNFGVPLSSLEYLVSEGLDFLIMEDNYWEEATTLKTFDTVVMLEDIVEIEPSEISEYTEHDDIRVRYTGHADMGARYCICEFEGAYYINVCGVNGEDSLHLIKPEYVELITSNIKAEKN